MHKLSIFKEVMKMSKNQHVVPYKDDWAVRRENSSRISSSYETQADAIDAARETARREHGEVVIHGENGRIRDKDSYGNDPNPPRDKKH